MELQKLEVVHLAKSSADKLYRLCTRDAPQLPKYVPEVVLNVEVIGEGPGGEIILGTVFVWTFIPVGGSAIVSKVQVTAVDNKKRSITWTVLEGDIAKDFKSFNFDLDITPKPGATDGTSMVKWSVEYEKANEDVPDPVGTVTACGLLTTILDLRLQKQA
ncbi:hypothetical protein MKW94_007185 [Papaver nudicaule]|uniref:Bet v I/Major latex protein domain-containing protein n=1 Tax=Papaver nudicaule TaxID=74823 RepID=A0AA41VPI6_PAPNU|nr:hypothetical protein [Papaver nudicaule]